MRIELERGEDQYDVIYLDPETCKKLVRWLEARSEHKYFNYPNEHGAWNILDVNTGHTDAGGIVQNHGQQKLLEEAVQ